MTHKWVYMTKQLSVVAGVVVGVITGVIARVVTRVSVELRLRLWKLDAVDDVRCSDNSPAVTATSVSISTPFSGALAAPASPLPPMGCFGGILIH